MQGLPPEVGNMYAKGVVRGIDMDTYKVWVQIERIPADENDGDYENIGLPDPLGMFDTLTEACAFVRQLPGWDWCRATSDYREED